MGQKQSRSTGSPGNINSFNLNSFNKTVHATIADGKPQVLQWLSSLEPQKRHEHLRGSRLGGVGQWIFGRGEFRRWNTSEGGSDHSVLFCHGNPGVGKTHLSSLVIDHFYGGGQESTVAGLYCDYLDRKEQTTSSMLGSVLRQLVGKADIPEDIVKSFEDAKEQVGGAGPPVPELLAMLKTIIAQRQRVVICIDGLDESLAAHRGGLLSSLQSLVRESPNVRLFLTGRPFIRSEIEKYFPDMNTLAVRPTKKDTEEFLRMKLGGDTEPDAMDERLRADIMKIIPQTMSEIFLLVSLSIDAILAETTVHRRKEKLKHISNGQDVGDVYSATLERIRAQNTDRSRLGMEAMMWVAYSERPLQPEELCQALGVEIGSSDLNGDNVPSIQTILNCGLGLIIVDSSSATVRLVHFTLQEYILANPTLFHDPHSAIAGVCLTYLNFSCIRDLSPALTLPPPTTPFLEYASYYWGAHARRGTGGGVTSLALKLLDKFDTHISAKLLLLKEYKHRHPFDIGGNPIGFTGLHSAAFLGVVEIMDSLLKTRKWDLDAADFGLNTALVWAARKGNDGVVKLLLEQEGISPDAADNRGRTPLSLSAGNGYKRITNMLLDRNDVNPDTADASGLTPFSWAAMSGHIGIVDVLLERNEVNPDRADESGRTPFSWAAMHGHGGVVERLLERNDVNPNTLDESGRTPFLWAAMCGHGGVVERLLERNSVNPDREDANGRTPLSWAAGNRYQIIVKLLLESDRVNPGGADRSGRTPFSWAAGNGDVGIVKVLLKRNDANPNTADKGGRTPFFWAAENGCEKVVEILLERSDINPDMADNWGRTPLSRAAGNGHLGISGMLLERNDVNPDAEDESGRTPFLWATMNGRKEIVDMLQDRHGLVAEPAPGGKSSKPLAYVPSELSEPPVKRIRRF